MTTCPTVRVVLAAVALLAMTSTWLAAQTPPAERHGRRDRMRAFLVLRIAEALDLSDEKALQISKILRDAEQRRQELRGRRHEVEQSLRTALAQPSRDDAAIAKLVAQANEIDEQLAMIPEQSFREAQGIVTVEQQARLILLRPEIQTQIRRKVERRLRKE